MNPADASEESGGDSAVGGAQSVTKTGREYVSEAARYVRREGRSGAVASVGGGVILLRGLRALGRGDRTRGLAGLLLGGAFLAGGTVQRRSADVDQTDVVDTSPDIEDAGPGPELDSDVEATEVEQTDVVGTGVDAEAVGEDDADPAGEFGAEDGAYDRLGEAAFDEHSGRVPAPQRAFNVGLLALDAEAVWGVREGDDAVFVSQLYDAIEDRDGVRYVASSQVDDDRMLTVPDTVLNHWDTVADGGIAVSGGDGIVFATADVLRADGLLRVVPERWSDEALGADE